MQLRHLEVEGETGWGATEKTGNEQGVDGEGSQTWGGQRGLQRGARRAVQGSAARRIPAEQNSWESTALETMGLQRGKGEARPVAVTHRETQGSDGD